MRLKSILSFGCAVAAASVFTSSAALALQVDVLVDKVSQHMIVKLDGVPTYDWLVSTGAPGYDTPSGNYRIFRMEEEHFSKEWDDAPMPYSMFFTGLGHAVHGSYHVKMLGRAASHGCVRLQPENAAILFGLIEEAGFKNNSVSVRGQAGLFQTEPLLTTNDTFKMTPKVHGAAVASMAPASITDPRPFWWQRPQIQQNLPVKQVEIVKQSKPKKLLNKVAKKDTKKAKKNFDPKSKNFFDFLKNQSET